MADVPHSMGTDYRAQTDTVIGKPQSDTIFGRIDSTSDQNDTYLLHVRFSVRPTRRHTE